MVLISLGKVTFIPPFRFVKQHWFAAKKDPRVFLNSPRIVLFDGHSAPVVRLAAATDDDEPPVQDSGCAARVLVFHRWQRPPCAGHRVILLDGPQRVACVQLQFVESKKLTSPQHVQPYAGHELPERWSEPPATRSLPFTTPAPAPYRASFIGGKDRHFSSVPFVLL